MKQKTMPVQPSGFSEINDAMSSSTALVSPIRSLCRTCLERISLGAGGGGRLARAFGETWRNIPTAYRRQHRRLNSVVSRLACRCQPSAASPVAPRKTHPAFLFPLPVPPHGCNTLPRQKIRSRCCACCTIRASRSHCVVHIQGFSAEPVHGRTRRPPMFDENLRNVEDTT